MNEREFEINGKKYQLNKIDVFKQFHIVRKLGPIMGDLIPIAMKLKNVSGEDLENFEGLGEMLQPILNGLAKLSDEDSTKVLMGLLEAVEVKESYGNFAFLVKNGVLMFKDLEMPEMLQCAGRAFMFNVGGFFSTATQLSKEGKRKLKIP